MNINVERLENHRARITVQVDAEYMAQANRKVAAKLSSEYRIPGFRKGKAPYSVVTSVLGHELVSQAMVEVVADAVYPKALRQSGLSPYTSGSLEDVQMEPTPTLVFTVPLRPEVVQLADYRSVRVEYDEPTVTDEEVDEALQRARPAERVPHEGPLEADLVAVLDLYSYFVDGDERPEDEGDSVFNVIYKGDEFEHLHDEEVRLSREEEPILPSLLDHLIGAKVGETLSFDITVPTDVDEFAHIAGRTVHFDVMVKAAFSERPVELTDELAASLTENENPPLNLEQLRERVRANLLSRKLSAYHNAYVTAVIDRVLEGSEVRFPLEAVEERIDAMVEDLENDLKKQSLSLEFYMQVLNLTKEAVRERYRADAAQFVQRSLIVSEIAGREALAVSARDVDAEITQMLEGQLARDAQRLRAFYNRREQREAIASTIVSRRINSYFMSLGRGLLEAPVATATTSES